MSRIHLVFFVLFLITCFFPSGSSDVMLFAYTAICIFYYKESTSLLYVLIFAITYPLFSIIAGSLGVLLHYLQPYVTDEQVYRSLSIQGFFWTVFFIFLGPNVPTLSFDLYPKTDRGVRLISNSALLVVSLAMVLFGLSNTVFSGYVSYGESASSIFLEYVLILQICSLLVCNTPKNRKFIAFNSLLIIFAALLLGRRLPAVMQFVLLALLFARHKGAAYHIGLVVVGFFVLSILAIVRTGANFDGDLLDAALAINSTGIMENNQGGVIYSSAAYVRLWDEGKFNFIFGVKSFFNMLLAAVLPSSMVNEAAFLNFSAMNYLPIPGNGGFVAVSFYARSGLLGVAAAAAILAWVIRASKNNVVAAAYTTFLMVTFPRWYAYNVNILFKMGVLLALTLIVITFLKKVSNRNKKWGDQTTNVE